MLVVIAGFPLSPPSQETVSVIIQFVDPSVVEEEKKKRFLSVSVFYIWDLFATRRENMPLFNVVVALTPLA